MIRRGFWLTAGAVAGIYGYRRVSAIGRRLSASLNPADPKASLTQSAKLARQGRRTAVGMARETYCFTRDVREGMELYMARRSEPPDPNLDTRTTNYDPETKHDTKHDPRPKDGP